MSFYDHLITFAKILIYKLRHVPWDQRLSENGRVRPAVFNGIGWMRAVTQLYISSYCLSSYCHCTLWLFPYGSPHLSIGCWSLCLNDVRSTHLFLCLPLPLCPATLTFKAAFVLAKLIPLEQGLPTFYYKEAIINFDQHSTGLVFLLPFVRVSTVVTITAVT